MDGSVALRNAALAAWKALLDGGTIQVFSGAIPTNAEDSTGSSVLLATLTNGGTGTGITFQTPASGVMAKTSAENWTGAVLANGTATYLRICGPGDAGTASDPTKARIQQTVGVTGAEVTLASVVLATGGDPVTLGGYEVRTA